MGLNWVSKGKYEKSHVPHCAEVFHSAVPRDLKCLAHYRNISLQLQDVDSNLEITYFIVTLSVDYFQK